MQRITAILILTLTTLGFGFKAISQPVWTDKITWSFKLEKIDESHAFVIATGKLIEGWHVFSVNHDPNKADLTGYPTKFIFSKSKDYNLIGVLQDGAKAKKVVDDLGTSLYFEKSGVFKQKIEILTDKTFDITFDYSFQICDENGCIFPPDQSAKVSVSGFKPSIEMDPSADGNTGNDVLSPQTQTLDSSKTNQKEILESPEIKQDTKPEVKSKSLWLIFFEGFGWGFIALLTPCVFPMIPMTVSFFTKQSKSRAKGIANALIYGFSIIAIYVSL